MKLKITNLPQVMTEAVGKWFQSYELNVDFATIIRHHVYDLLRRKNKVVFSSFVAENIQQWIAGLRSGPSYYPKGHFTLEKNGDITGKMQVRIGNEIYENDLSVLLPTAKPNFLLVFLGTTRKQIWIDIAGLYIVDLDELILLTSPQLEALNNILKSNTP